MGLFQLKGRTGDNIGLYEVPEGIDAQGAFNEAVEHAAIGRDVEQNDIDGYINKKFNITRVFAEEVFTFYL